MATTNGKRAQARNPATTLQIPAAASDLQCDELTLTDESVVRLLREATWEAEELLRFVLHAVRDTDEEHAVRGLVARLIQLNSSVMALTELDSLMSQHRTDLVDHARSVILFDKKPSEAGEVRHG
jgi:hypothetical protein